MCTFFVISKVFNLLPLFVSNKARALISRVSTKDTRAALNVGFLPEPFFFFLPDSLLNPAEECLPGTVRFKG